MNKLGTLMLIVLILAPFCCGQEVKATSASTTDGQSVAATNSRPPEDFQPASGAQPFSLGLGGRKQMDISLFTTQSWDSAGNGNYSGTNWQPTSSFGGNLQLALDRESSQTILNYNGHAIVYPNREPVWNTYQTLAFSHSLKIGRWGLTAIDTFSLSPDSPFGGFGFGLPGTSGTGVLNSQYVPNQSVLTSYATNYNNSVTGQVSYGLSRRANVTASLAYGIMRFTEADFQNSNQITASTGYNYSLTAKDTVSATYSFGRIAYNSFDGNYVSHTMQVGYSHKLSGRMAIQFAGGPEIVDTTNLGTAGTRIQASGSASLIYSRARNNMSLSYFRGTTGGSGVLTGATTQSASMGFSREFSKASSMSVAVGYANNSGLIQQQSYDAFYVSPSLRRAVTRNLGLTFNYSYQHQLSSSNCVTSVCGDLARSFVSVGLDYRFRPIRLE